uniref:Ribosomal protein S7 n=1 Tax=Chlorodesmis fastigiata TaxID=189431 RepID=A0A2P0QIV4_CHLFS|nr:ribosomal protein S7 [Chlorodesmis fastigiata]ARO74199.1 ribosomal protein S7 [Chlorodesmis fastigiata]
MARITNKTSNSNLFLISQRLMKHGKKKLAHRILQKSLVNIQNKTKQDPLSIIEKAIQNTTLSVKIQTRRMRGTVSSIPSEISLDRGISRGIRWILSSAKRRSGNTFALNLANEFIDASKKAGNAFRKKQELQKIADTNRFVRIKKKKPKKKNQKKRLK